MGWVSKEDERRFEERMEQRMIDEYERIFGWNYIEEIEGEDNDFGEIGVDDIDIYTKEFRSK